MGYSLSNLRAISEGYAPDMVDLFGGEMMLAEGANIQAHNIKTSPLAKSAKAHMKAAKASRHTDKAKAKKEYEAAIHDLKELKKACEEIEDDHAVTVFVETFVKAFVPAFVGCMLAGSTGGVSVIIGDVLAYIIGLAKTIDYSAAVEKGMAPNKAGAGGKYDPSQWWKQGQTRGAAMTYFDRMITACEKGKDLL